MSSSSLTITVISILLTTIASHARFTYYNSQVLRQIDMFRKMPPALRKKHDKQQTEALAEEAAFVMAVVKEVQSAMPISMEVLQSDWVDKYRSGDSDVVLEVQSAIMNKNRLNVRDIGSVQAIMNSHAAPFGGNNSVAVQMSELQASTFELKMKQMQYDVQALRVAKAKRASWETQVYHAKLQYRVQAYQESTKAAEHFINSNCCLLHYTKTEKLTFGISSFVKEQCNKFKLDANAGARSRAHMTCCQSMSSHFRFIIQ